jgi:predicted nucleic acid-binding protein
VTCAIDASALVAYLKHETGWNVVAALLADADNDCYAHAVNVGEVYLHFLRTADRTHAEEAVEDLERAGVKVRVDLDPAFWKDVFELISVARQPGRHLPLADAFGIGLARRLGCELVTADHGDMDPLLPLGFCSVRFIR